MCSLTLENGDYSAAQKQKPRALVSDKRPLVAATNWPITLHEDKGETAESGFLSAPFGD